MREKSTRYNSHKDIPSRCIQEKLVPKGLELSLEPAVGNYDQEFIDNWYSNLKDFSRILMKQTVAFCEKTEAKTERSITEIEATLKRQLKKDDYAQMQNTPAGIYLLKNNNRNTRTRCEICSNLTIRIPERRHRRQNIKQNLLYKTTNFTEENESLENSPTTARPTYAEILKDKKNPSIKTSTRNLNNYKTNKNKHKKLRSRSLKIRTRKQGNIPSRNSSNTNMVKDDKYQQEINERKEEMKLLEQSKKQQHYPKNNIISESKNENTASVSQGANKRISN